MPSMDRFELCANFFEGLVPTDGDKLPVYFFQRLCQAIGTVREIAHLQALDAGIAPAGNMIRVRLYINDSIIPGTDNQTTLRLADTTDGFPMIHDCHHATCLVPAHAKIASITGANSAGIALAGVVL
jgi:hypothetical protein